MTEERNLRKVRQGVVVSDVNDKTIVVMVEERKPHPVYGKMMTSTASATPFKSWKPARCPSRSAGVW